MVKNCKTCKKSLEKIARKDYIVSDNETFCKQCYKANKRDSASPNTSINEGTEAVSTNYVTLSFPRGGASHKCCMFLCNQREHTDRKLRVLTKTQSVELFLKYGILCPLNSRACETHFTGDSIEIPEGFQAINGLNLSATDIESYFNTMKKMLIKLENEVNKKNNDVFNDMNEALLVHETGMTKANLDFLLTFLDDQGLHVQNKSFALGLYLSRLRRGYTYEELSNRYRCTVKTARSNCREVSNTLSNNFTNHFLKISLNRDEILCHLTASVKHLHAPSETTAVLILDGTYLFIEKSSNFKFQRETYSMQKHRNLIKPMMAVYPDGYIADVFGPYPGNKNDASILNDLLDEGVWGALQTNDVFLVDRGFRDSISKATQKGFVIKMPDFSNSPSAQLTTEQANRSRLVTKNRYVVEQANGRVKQHFSYFEKVIRNTTLTGLFQDFRVACALLNMRFKPPKEAPIEIDIAARMLSLQHLTNNLAQLVDEERLNYRRAAFQRIEEVELNRFPRLSYDELVMFCCGTYQLRMAKSYYAEHVQSSGDFEFQITRESTNIDYFRYEICLPNNDSLLIRTKIRSRHVNSVKYFAYILVDTRQEGINAIIGHTCQCKVGLRMVGCCSHIATLIWYFAYGKFLPEIQIPAQHLDSYFNDQLDELNDSDDD